MSDIKYMVYVGFVDHELVYIGKGQDGRERHLNKGRSHVYEAYELHFNGGHVSFDKMHVGSEEQATKLEEVFIKLFNPVWNKVHTGERRRVDYKKDVRAFSLPDNIANSITYLMDSVENLETELEDTTNLLVQCKENKELLEKTLEDIKGEVLEESYVGVPDKPYVQMLVSKGLKTSHIAELTGKSERTIQRWKKEMPS